MQQIQMPQVRRRLRASGINTPVKDPRAALRVAVGVGVMAPRRLWTPTGLRGSAGPLLPGCPDLSALPREPPNCPLVNKTFISQAGGEKFQAFIIKCPGEGQLPNSGAGCPSGG